MFRYFGLSAAFTAACLLAAAALGFHASGVQGALAAVFICAVLGVLEVSLSFDNAVVNAKMLGGMPPVWRRRFLTWGVLVAVFGMRLVFPLLIVGLAARLGPVDALHLALTRPEEYERIVTGAHVAIAGFGGAFLAMVGLKFFFDADKEVDWIAGVERLLRRFSDVEAFEIALVLAALLGVSRLLTGGDALVFISSGLLGLLAFIAVGAVSSLLEVSEDGAADAGRAGLAAFLYLELLDASFSFDGVIGAFALSNNLLIIALGLGIGAMFVRSLTIMLVEKGTLSEYRYLEHGAFWAILALAGLMMVSARYEIPELVTGLLGAGLIVAALATSILYNRAHPETDEEPEKAPTAAPRAGVAV